MESPVTTIILTALTIIIAAPTTAYVIRILKGTHV